MLQGLGKYVIMFSFAPINIFSIIIIISFPFSVSRDEIMMMGRWCSDQFDKSYLTALPFNGLLGQAGVSKEIIDYNPHNLSYFVGRSQVEVPDELLIKIFPWVDTELPKIKSV